MAIYSIVNARLTIKVVPGSSRDKIVGWLGDALKIRVRAQPEKGKANAAVVALLADVLGVPARALTVSRGHTAQLKIIEISGVSDAELRGKIDRALA